MLLVEFQLNHTTNPMFSKQEKNSSKLALISN